MNEDRFDVIIVGGGLAGSAAALELARNGVDVLVLERGRSSGSKNMTGGRLYGHGMEKLIPDFAAKAPIERIVTKERVSLMTEQGAFTMDYDSTKLKDPTCASYTVLRAKFDPWLAAQAEEAGAMYVLRTRVDNLIKKDGKVIGVESGGEMVYADAVILADGVNSLLAQRAGLKKELGPSQVAVGVKEVVKLDEQTVSDRFGLQKGDGASWLFAGYPTDGAVGGGFLYTNRESVSLGIVATISDIEHSQASVPEMVERLKNHPTIKPLIEGGARGEYSAHLVPEAGFNMMPQLYGDGVLVAGDAAGFCINLGYIVRGMDLAIESGRLAAQAILEARKKNDYSSSSLSRYRALLDDSFVMRDLSHYKDAPQLMENHLMFETLPQIADEAMGAMFEVDGSAKAPLMKEIKGIVSNHGGFKPLLKVAKKARKAL